MTKEVLEKALSYPDLSDSQNGKHAVFLALEKIGQELSKIPGWVEPIIHRVNPITSVANNFDRLLFPIDNIGRSSVYTRYISEDRVLRSHTSAMIPDLLDQLKASGVEEHLAVCAGLCYRRDVVDRLHQGEHHQVDIWYIRRGEPRMGHEDMMILIEAILKALGGGYELKIIHKIHPYTVNGMEIDILVGGEWVEILECGEINPQILKNAQMPPEGYSGLAMGVGLDRFTMILKGIDDIRLLRSSDPRVSGQMTNLDRFQPVSKYPAVKHDLSYSVPEDYTEEDVCEAIREAADEDLHMLELVQILSETPYKNLPEKAKERLGIHPGQKNVLVRIIFRSMEGSLTQRKTNQARDRIYLKVNKSGTRGYL